MLQTRMGGVVPVVESVPHQHHFAISVVSFDLVIRHENLCSLLFLQSADQLLLSMTPWLFRRNIISYLSTAQSNCLVPFAKFDTLALFQDLEDATNCIIFLIGCDEYIKLFLFQTFICISRKNLEGSGSSWKFWD